MENSCEQALSFGADAFNEVRFHGFQRGRFAQLIRRVRSYRAVLSVATIRHTVRLRMTIAVPGYGVLLRSGTFTIIRIFVVNEKYSSWRAESRNGSQHSFKYFFNFQASQRASANVDYRLDLLLLLSLCVCVLLLFVKREVL